jgi:phosphoribosylformylglycinamidine synthase
MPPEVIAVGETQERLCWILPGDVTPDVLRIYNEEFSLPQIARGACATVIGAVQGEKQYVLRHGDDIVMDVPIEFLTGSIRDELPVRPMSERNVTDIGRRYIAGEHRVADLLPRVLEHRDVCSREPLYVRYDWVVRGTTVIPRGQASAGVIAPIMGSPLGVALAVAGNPRLSKADPHLAAQYAVLEAVRRVVSVGARPLGLTDCLNFGNPQNIEHYSELVHAIDGIALAARHLGTPFVSGNVSLYNESKSGNAIPASPIIACVGGVDDVAQVVTASLKRSGNVLFLLGRPRNAAGGAVFAELVEQTGGPVPPIDYDRAVAEIAYFRAAADGGFIRSARSIGNGGVLATLAEMAFPTLAPGHVPVGVRIEAAHSWTGGVVGDLEAYFGECGGFIIEASPDDARALTAIASEGVDLIRIGETIAQPMLCVAEASFDLRELYDRWSKPLAEIYP